MSMRLRDKILYMSFGAGLVVLGMVLNSLVGGDADAQVGVQDATFGNVTCRNLLITDGDKPRGAFGLTTKGNAILEIYGDDGGAPVVHLGPNVKKDNEMTLLLKSKSRNDKREISMSIDENGGRFDCFNKIGENVVRLVVGADGGGSLDMRDKWGYKR